ncbi:TRAP transporter substrate-binding protein [Clostridium sp. AM58-1XD]|uniref:TRAP transporter substrate-binding protein n=1 Tax=Clostridium sp. AM58-1XD TaxID=2292307 RepID=UPI000E48A0F4|nr:TRAP transporter substrate-binding protein [Clostridium sp. AM58-1XD]RGY97632.1 hypothetical protein DXA13_14055 [Clostridium sp. AM58-1XD]
MTKKLMAMLISTVAAVSLSGCLSGGNKPAAGTAAAESSTVKTDSPDKTEDKKPAEYTLTFSGTVSDEHLVTKVEYYFRDKVEELTDGRVVIKVYNNNQLGGPTDVLSQVASGDIDMSECASIQLAGYTNQLKWFNLPFLWESKDAAMAFLKSEEGIAIRDKAAEETNIVILGYADNGFFNLYSNKPIESPSQLKGFKIRCQESDVLLQIWDDLGANPMPMSFAELYTALQQGTVDGMFNGYVTPASGGYWEVQDYISRIAVIYDVFTIQINKDLYESMPEDIRQALNDAMAEAQEYGLELAEQDNLAAKQKLLDNGMEIIDVMGDEDLYSQWVTAAQPTYDWFRKTYPDIDLDTILDGVKKYNEMYPGSDKDVK